VDAWIHPTNSNAGKFHMIGAGVQPNALEDTTFSPRTSKTLRPIKRQAPSSVNESRASYRRYAFRGSIGCDSNRRAPESFFTESVIARLRSRIDLYPPDPAASFIANNDVGHFRHGCLRGRCINAGLTFFAEIQTVQSARDFRVSSQSFLASPEESRYSDKCSSPQLELYLCRTSLTFSRSAESDRTSSVEC